MEKGKFMTAKLARLMVGLFLCGTSCYLNIQANIGLGAWEAFQMGISGLTGISYGNISVLVGVAIVVIDAILHESIGFGTIINAIVIGKTADFWSWLGCIPKANNFYIGLAVLLLSQLMMSVGTYLYIREGLGGGPRDSLMTALSKRLPRVPVGYIRGMIEGTVLVLGYLMGAKVGVGTVISVCGISIVIQKTFQFFHFDLKSVEHQNVFQTIRWWKEGTVEQ